MQHAHTRTRKHSTTTNRHSIARIVQRRTIVDNALVKKTVAQQKFKDYFCLERTCGSDGTPKNNNVFQEGKRKIETFQSERKRPTTSFQATKYLDATARTTNQIKNQSWKREKE